jgi:hypothetical protein
VRVAVRVAGGVGVGANLYTPHTRTHTHTHTHTVPLAVDDVGAEVLGAWREYDVGGGVSDARFALFWDTPVKGDRFVTWFVT